VDAEHESGTRTRGGGGGGGGGVVVVVVQEVQKPFC
jgi:hypothetical protein